MVKEYNRGISRRTNNRRNPNRRRNTRRVRNTNNKRNISNFKYGGSGVGDELGTLVKTSSDISEDEKNNIAILI